MTTPLLAYHNDHTVKAFYLARVAEHQAADEIMQGYGYWQDGKGCAVGCTVHVDSWGKAHQRYPIELGIPEEIAYLEDHFFEQLPADIAKAWPARFLSCITPGADLSRVYDLWSAWNLIDPVDGVINHVSDDFPDGQRIVREIGESCLNGDRVSETRARAASAAAWAAAWAAEAAAWAAARAARAARAASAAARAAAWAAEAAAWAAARAARAARAASAAASAAAEAAYYERASDKLIELLSTAPVPAGVAS